MSIDRDSLFPPSDVDPAQLEQALADVDHICIRAKDWGGSHINGFDDIHVCDAAAIESFREVCKVREPDEHFHLMASGLTYISLYRGGEEILILSDFYHNWIRCSLWESDAYIVNSYAWCKWFEQQGYSSLLKGFWKDQRRCEEQKEKHMRLWALRQKNMARLHMYAREEE